MCKQVPPYTFTGKASFLQCLEWSNITPVGSHGKAHANLDVNFKQLKIKNPSGVARCCSDQNRK